MPTDLPPLASVGIGLLYPLEKPYARSSDVITAARDTFIATPKLKLLLKNYRLSDDIAFRFSNKGWEQWPLTAEKFARWVNQINGNGQVCNLFMDYETFGEHQWADTGIFDFLKHMPGELLKHGDNNFLTPSQVIDQHEAVGEIDLQPCARLVLYTDGLTDTTNRCLKSAAAQIAVDDMSLRQPTLDEVFLTLTGHAADPTAEAVPA